ncbi:MAG TPA: nitrilase-related carbon-nitrogen hydrolase [Terracidiphilus sp.]|nr:nitrilase-related carbon-nitrogen hydrolase [Terracidiphilus sp.]
MAFARNLKRILIALLVIAATAVLVYFGDGLNPVWPLMWFAPLPVLWFAAHSSWWEAAIAAYVAWLLGFLNMYHYFHLLDSLWFRVYPFVALLVTIGVLLFRLMVRRRAAWNALVAFPAVWVSFEYLLNRTTSGGTAGSLAYTQLHFLPFLQLASITGPWGMSFLMLLFPSAIAIWIHLRKSDPGPARRVLVLTIALLSAVLGFGAARLSEPPPDHEANVGLIASDQSDNVDTASAGPDAERLLRAYAEVAQNLAAEGAQILVLPEKIAVAADPGTASVDAIFQSLAEKTGATIVVGLLHVVPPDKYNEARVYTSGAAPLSYDKEHMLPPFESNLKPGVTRTLLRKPSGTWGVAICKDMDFTQLSRSYGQADTGLMLVPAWDFNLDRSWHGHIAVMRGVENGFSIVRVAKNGYLTVSDDRGRIVAETRSDAAPFATLIAAVPTVHDETLYLKWGDWFAWLTVGILAVSLLRALFTRPEASAGS